MTYLFVGGPADGKRYTVPEGATSFVFAILAPWTAFSAKVAYASPYVNEGRAEYVRYTIGSPQLHTVFVFTGVSGLRPEPGAKIAFEGRLWGIDDIRLDKGWGGAWFRAVAGTKQHTLRLDARLADIVYTWELEAWTFRPGTTIRVNEERYVVAA